MSINRTEANDRSSTPEDSAECRYGDCYIYLREAIQRGPRFTVQAYLPESGGMKTVTNDATANGTLRIIEENSMKEPDESEPIYFDLRIIKALKLDVNKLKDLKKEFQPEQTGVYRRIGQDVLERVADIESKNKAG